MPYFKNTIKMYVLFGGKGKPIRRNIRAFPQRIATSMTQLNVPVTTSRLLETLYKIVNKTLVAKLETMTRELPSILRKRVAVAVNLLNKENPTSTC